MPKGRGGKCTSQLLYHWRGEFMFATLREALPEEQRITPHVFRRFSDHCCHTVCIRVACLPGRVQCTLWAISQSDWLSFKTLNFRDLVRRGPALLLLDEGLLALVGLMQF